jgi:phosphonate transport system substrate-binding protein
MKKTFILCATILALFMAGCKSKGDLDSNGVPGTLMIGMVQTDNMNQVKEAREAVVKYLQKKLNMPVEIYYSTDYNGVIEALKAHKIHLAEIPPFAYVIATRTMKLTPIVTLGTNGKPTTYQSVLIANAHSNIKTMADVKANSKNLTLSFVDPASTSGHLIPRAYLNSIGLNPDTAFKQTIFSGSHPATVLAVKSGKIDIGCTTNMIFGLMVQNKMLNENDVRVLWTSAPIPADPIAARSDINPEFLKKVQNAYLSMNTEAPQIIDTFVKLFLHDKVKRGFMVVQDSSYDGLRRIANGVKDLK